MKQASSLYIYFNFDKTTANYLSFYAGGSIQFNFAYIPDRINHLRVGRIKFDTCNIRYHA